jgi:caffeoyl-CoA O-methyltransferase
MKKIYILILLISALFYLGPGIPSPAAELQNNPELDKQVQQFLKEHEYEWYDMNIPSVDGQLLYNLVIKGRYKKALEIGTSTGHSAIWIAWALSKTGGKLITIEIDKERYEEALRNFKEAGLSEYIDARLADAHELVKELKGPFDFIFCDADKGWYKNYFIDLDPKIKTGGCYTAHNVSDSLWGRRGGRGTGAFRDYIKTRTDYKTHFDSRGAGMSISYKLAVQ